MEFFLFMTKPHFFHKHIQQACSYIITSFSLFVFYISSFQRLFLFLSIILSFLYRVDPSITNKHSNALVLTYTFLASQDQVARQDSRPWSSKYTAEFIFCVLSRLFVVCSFYGLVPGEDIMSTRRTFFMIIKGSRDG